MSSSITIYPYNILELGTLTVTGTPDTGYPEARLHDRSKNLYWFDTVTEAKAFEVDQGAADNLAVDFLAIEGHNFSGEDMQWQYSATGAWAGEEVDAVTDWTQGDNLQIIKTLTAQTKRYWRVTLTSMADPRCGEIFIGGGYEFDIQTNPSGSRISNVQWNRTIGGDERGTKFGDLRRSRSYSLFLSAADLATLKTAIDYTDHMSKPVYIRDHFDEYFLCRFTADIDESFDNKTHTHVNIDIVEIL